MNTLKLALEAIELLTTDNASEQAQAAAADARIKIANAMMVEPVGWVSSSEIKQADRFGGSVSLWRKKYPDCDTPLYLHPPQQVAVTSGARAELIAHLRSFPDEHSSGYADDLVIRAAVMLEADAQQSKRAPMTPQELRDWWASENKLEDCDMCKLHDFETVVRAVEARFGITQADKHKPTDWSAA